MPFFNSQKFSFNKTARCVVLFIYALILALADQISKTLIFNPTRELAYSDAWIHLTKFRNYNFAFSLPVPPWLMYAIYIAIAITCGLYLYKNAGTFSRNKHFFWLLIVTGGLCNIIERLCLGYVRDFIAVPFGGIVNFADIYIVAGIVYLLWYELQTHKTDATKEHN